MPTPNNNSILTIKDFFDRHNGLQRSNRFSMSFVNLPEGLPQLPNQDLNPIAVTIGSRAIDGVADNLAGYGPGRTVPRSQKFPQGVQIAFPITNDHFITDFFDAWFNKIYSGGRQQGNYSKPFQLSYYDDIIANTQMKISMLDPNGNINRTFTFYEIYPIENLPIELNMLKTNEYSMYQVLMYFRDFTFKSGS
jgi:hypothetical protein